ncbi:hypothetical protein [Dolichospermum compactum]|uniref:Arginyl-tRNA synthetase n=1 Tax=Dolichospermum compactum NIES-806 TaxID=1973481 RepID=A0A1Z4UY57_9CYAN|nr:hypothetical protein [Dolichospermum compactum]BAZ84123.1 arginyl-tRNA synthetase [Dolichospermum compactum NIES-806]
MNTSFSLPLRSLSMCIGQYAVFQETSRQEVVRLQAGAEDTLHAWKKI